MPTYSYKCQGCNEAFDRIVPMDERNEQFCGTCGSKLKREFVPPIVHMSVFKPDWYWVDSKTKIFASSKRELFDECRRRGKFAKGYGQDNTE